MSEEAASNPVPKQSVCKFILPDHREIIIRESNGQDEEDFQTDINVVGISRALATFLSKITVKLQGNIGPVTADDIQAMKLRCIYYIFFKWRQHSLSNIFNFEFQWHNVEGPSTYSEDLTRYTPDYFSHVEGETTYDPFAIQPYPITNPSYREFNLASGKHIRYEYITGLGENYLLELPEGKSTATTEMLKARSLQQNISGEWVRVTNFSFFSSKDMAELRGDMEKHDAQFLGITEVPHPLNPKIIEYKSLVQTRNFLFPAGI